MPRFRIPAARPARRTVAASRVLRTHVAVIQVRADTVALLPVVRNAHVEQRQRQGRAPVDADAGKQKEPVVVDDAPDVGVPRRLRPANVEVARLVVPGCGTGGQAAENAEHRQADPVADASAGSGRVALGMVPMPSSTGPGPSPLRPTETTAPAPRSSRRNGSRLSGWSGDGASELGAARPIGRVSGGGRPRSADSLGSAARVEARHGSPFAFRQSSRAQSSRAKKIRVQFPARSRAFGQSPLNHLGAVVSEVDPHGTADTTTAASSQQHRVNSVWSKGPGI